MKKILFFAAVLLYVQQSFAQDCVSGNCQNGTGKLVYTSHFNGKAEIMYEYTGDFINGERNGKGIFVYYTGPKDTSIMYEGNFKDGHYFGKGVLSIRPFSTITSDSWIDDQNCTRGVEYRPGTNETSQGSFVKSNFERDKPLRENMVAAVAITSSAKGNVSDQRTADEVAGRVKKDGGLTIHSKKIVSLSTGSFSTITTWGMMGSFYAGFKRYFICPELYSKKNPIPFGAHFTYELVSSKKELVMRSEKRGNDLCFYFDVANDGDYSIQVKYDYDGCAGCQQIDGLRLSYTLYSQDYIKTNP